VENMKEKNSERKLFPHFLGKNYENFKKQHQTRKKKIGKKYQNHFLKVHDIINDLLLHNSFYRI
jgi:hypothetical protein